MLNINNEVRRVRVNIQGHWCEVPADESILTACMRHAAAAPSVICGMGSCYACVVTRNDGERVRACITQVSDGDSYDW